MIAFPFSNAFVIDRAKKGKQGEYMAFYSISFSAAHIFGHNSGMQLIDNFGFDNTWSLITILGFIGVLCLWILIRVTNKEKNIV